jgi:DNA-binding NtrC family response regulator
MGEPFCWEAEQQRLQAALDLVAPALLMLPAAPLEVASEDPLLPVVGRAMSGLVDLLGVFALQRETLLLSGPTGTGKSRLANWVHVHSSRCEGPFETLELLSVPETMQMGELFGWRRGAFSGAVADKAGAIARAEGGTLFLDEVDKLSLQAQAGLLRLIETRTWRPLGDSGPIRRADIRFIAGTNIDLGRAVSEGRFREDLYYRINVLPVRLPTLAERVDEIDAWAAFMLGRRHAESSGQGPSGLSPSVGPMLRAQAWPGNLRQLDNVIRRSFVIGLSEGSSMLHRRHVQRALAFERSPDGASLIGMLRLAAAGFVDAVVRTSGSEAAVELEHAAALRGFILEAARDHTGSIRDAFSLLGRDAVVRNRNHSTEYRKELMRVEELIRIVQSD